ncbi:MAG: hypothetical protein JO360_09575 [Acidobacteria bacterium]|nr:hypothetical protein [Acidobacteriota bacterium]
MRRIFRENGLSIALFSMFFLTLLIGQTWTGYRENNHNREDHGLSAISYPAYLVSDHFLEATAENWESEFLQMFVFIVLTAFLYQKGSAESKDPDKKEETVDREPKPGRPKKNAPWPVRKGGFVLKVYENSLSLAMLLLFLLSFLMHALGGKGEYNQDQLLHGGEQVTMLGYMGTSRFWFESLQNWQSEFLAIGSMVVLTIWLRQKGSPESKPVDSPHSQTGSD